MFTAVRAQLSWWTGRPRLHHCAVKSTNPGTLEHTKKLKRSWRRQSRMLWSTWLPRVSQATFESTAKIFRTADYVAKNDKMFTDFEKLVGLQKANSVNLGKCHSRWNGNFSRRWWRTRGRSPSWLISQPLLTHRSPEGQCWWEDGAHCLSIVSGGAR